jgi:hypothetical protein
MIFVIQWLLICLLASASMMVIVAFARSRVITRLRRSHPSRGLFSFSDGYRIRSVDPIAVLNAMESHPQYRFDLHPARVLEGEKEAMDITVDAVRQAFGIPPFTAPGRPGLTHQECLRLLNAFRVHIAVQKKSTESTAISSPSTAAT